MQESQNTADESAGGPTYSHDEVVAGEQGILPGARVFDKDADDADEMVVLKCMRQTVSEVFVDGEAVADLESNEEYPNDDTAVICAYTASLDLQGYSWRKVDRAVLHETLMKGGKVSTYTYPASRLTTEVEG